MVSSQKLHLAALRAELLQLLPRRDSPDFVQLRDALADEMEQKLTSGTQCEDAGDVVYVASDASYVTAASEASYVTAASGPIQSR